MATVPPRYYHENPLVFMTEDDFRNKCFRSEDTNRVNPYRLTANKRVRLKKRPRRGYVQVYTVQFLKYDRKDIELGQIYGTIELHNYTVFNRQMGQSTCHDIDPEGFVRLCLEDPIYAGGYVLILHQVFRGNQPGDYFHPDNKGRLEIDDPEDEPVNGPIEEFLSVPEAYEKHPYNELILESTETVCGTIRVAYSILMDAAEFYLTIKLVEWRGEGSCANIYGQVFASDTGINNGIVNKFNYRLAKSSVFDRKKDEELLSVKPGEFIPLQRPVNAVSYGNSLELDICLYHKNSSMGCSRDDNEDEYVIFEDILCLKAKCGWFREEGGLSEGQQIEGYCCMLEVEVHWLPYWSPQGG